MISVPEEPSAGNSQSSSRPVFQGFPDFQSNVLYCPKQFFTVVIPNASVNCIRVTSFMLRQTLGWLGKDGKPLPEQQKLNHRYIEEHAGIVHNALPPAIAEAVERRYIRRICKAQKQTLGVKAQTGVYELNWDTMAYTDEPESFRGFYPELTYTDHSGQNRIARKNIPNVFFDSLVKYENRSVIRVVGALLWYSITWRDGAEHKDPVQRSLRDLERLTNLSRSNVSVALADAAAAGYLERIEPGAFDLTGKRQGKVTVYGIKWTKSYSYSPAGVPIEVAPENPGAANTSQTHSGDGTLPKRTTDPSEHVKNRAQNDGTRQKQGTDPGEHVKNRAQNTSKTGHREHVKNRAIITTNTGSSNSITCNNNSSSSVVGEIPDNSGVSVVAAPNNTLAECVHLLRSAGFSDSVAQSLAQNHPPEVIRSQIAFLPKRNATQNPWDCSVRPSRGTGPNRPNQNLLGWR